MCLPTHFTGGTLVTHRGGQKLEFDWSSTPEGPLSEICWAAFFCDVEHEILPVTSGYRLTLTYNLYACKEMPNSISAGSQFHKCLQKAVTTPHFMRKGGCLGFDCEHAYAFSMLNEKEQLPHVLKGADYMVFSAARSLQLRVAVKPIAESDCCIYICCHTFHKSLTGLEDQMMMVKIMMTCVRV